MKFAGILLLALIAGTGFAQAPSASYKEMGSPNAKIRFEAYTDYECPYCAAFFRDVMPNIMTQYVNTGKILFVHRDFPLSQHPHSMLAARYANAAGQLGQYEVVVNQLFKTQPEWGVEGGNTGDVDGEVAKVLPPGTMLKVRAIVKNDTHLDDGILKDRTMGEKVDNLQSTPWVVIVVNGKRESISNSLPFSVWKSYLDAKLAALK